VDKILIVEDDKAILMGIKDDLEFEGYEVSIALDGKEGQRGRRRYTNYDDYSSKN